MDESEISSDNRGGEKGQSRKYTPETKRQIIKIRLAFFLLNLGVYPLYIAPRSPWNNGQVEGFNRVFSKKFWNKLQFSDEQEIDVKIKDFNIAYEKYSRLVSNRGERTIKAAIKE
ncbi:MAG: transposase [Methanophagales archaeon]|nr:transposase [Methanophagales archaeon]